MESLQADKLLSVGCSQAVIGRMQRIAGRGVVMRITIAGIRIRISAGAVVLASGILAVGGAVITGGD